MLIVTKFKIVRLLKTALNFGRTYQEQRAYPKVAGRCTRLRPSLLKKVWTVRRSIRKLHSISAVLQDNYYFDNYWFTVSFMES